MMIKSVIDCGEESATLRHVLRGGPEDTGDVHPTEGSCGLGRQEVLWGCHLAKDGACRFKRLPRGLREKYQRAKPPRRRGVPRPAPGAAVSSHLLPRVGDAEVQRREEPGFVRRCARSASVQV